METFSIQGIGGYITIEIEEVFGFPTNTSHFGGYDTKSKLKIKSNGYFVYSDLWASTGELYDFFEKLEIARSLLSGDVDFTSSERNLLFTLSYNNLGHVFIKGEFCENHIEDNLLKFEIRTDQSYN